MPMQTSTPKTAMGSLSNRWTHGNNRLLFCSADVPGSTWQCRQVAKCQARGRTSVRPYHAKVGRITTLQAFVAGEISRNSGRPQRVRA